VESLVHRRIFRAVDLRDFKRSVCARSGRSIAILPEFAIFTAIEFYGCLASPSAGTSKTTLESRKGGAVVALLEQIREGVS
jgi:hypothetical protein